MLKDHKKKINEKFPFSSLYFRWHRKQLVRISQAAQTRYKHVLSSSSIILYIIFEKLVKTNYPSTSISHPKPRLFLVVFPLAPSIQKIFDELSMTEWITMFARDGLQYELLKQPSGEGFPKYSYKGENH